MKNKTIHKAFIWKTIFLLVCFLFTNQKIKAQGVDVIFWMDNSGSIDATEWTNMSNNTKSLIDMVLGCNANNRISVVHYAAPSNTASSSRIYIETDFTNNATTAKGFVRRGGISTALGAYDFAHEALAIIGNALDGVANANIISAQKTLNRNTNNKLVIFLFTDAERYDISSSGSTLVNYSDPTGNPFLNYNLFKSNRGATFVVLKALGSDVTNTNAAAAAIASRGGAYTGTVESNPGDPEGGSGVPPRKMIYNATFTPSAADLAQLQNDICRSCAPLVTISSVTPPTQTVCQNTAAQNLVTSATGSGTLSYQWYSNVTNSTTGGTPISGATSASYTPSTSTVGTLYYYIVVTDTACDGTTTSATVTVTVTACCNAGNTGPNIN